MAYQSRLELVIDSRSGERSLRRLDQALDRTESKGEKTFVNLKTLAAGFAGALATIGVGTGFARVFDTLARFDKELATLRAVTRGTAEDMAAFSEQARRLGATTVFGASQAAEAQKFLAQAGLEVNQVLAATPDVLSLAQAGMLDLGEAADLATDIMAQMGLQVSDLSRINDVLVATSQSATTDVRQLGEAFSYAGPIAESFGLTLEETSAALGVISSGGVKASRAGTGLLGVLRQLANPSKEAAAALNTYGVTLGEVDVSANGFLPVVQRLADANISAADAFTIFGSEAGAAAQIMLKNRDAVANLNTELGGVEGRAKAAAGTMSDNLASAAVGLNSAFEGLILRTGEDGLTGNLKEMVDISAGVVRVFAGLEDTLDSTFSEDQVDTIDALATGIELLAVVAGTRLTAALASSAAGLAANTAAAISDARAEAIAASAVTRRTGAELASAKALLSTAQLEARATAGTNAHGFALAQLSAARVSATQAAGAHAAATNASTAAMARASVAARGLSTAMALVGGPLGITLIAVGSLYYFREELGLVQRQAGLSTDELEKLRGEIDDLSDAALNNRVSRLSDDLEEATLKAASARQELANLKAEQTGSGVLGFSGGQVGAEVRGLQAVAEAQERIKSINQELSETRKEIGSRSFKTLNDWLFETDVAAGAASDGIRKLAGDAKGLTDAQKEAARLAEQFADSLRTLEDRLFPVEAAQRQFRQEQMLLQTALMSGKISIDRYFEAWQRLQDAQRNQQSPSEAYGSGPGVAGGLSGGFTSQIGPRDMTGAQNQSGWESWLTSAETAFTDFDAMAANTAENFQRGFGQAFESMIFDSQSFGDSMYSLFDGITRTLVQSLGEMAAQWVAYQAVQLALGQTTQATTAATAAATGASIAAAYAPAAAMASLASFGANSAPAMAGIASTSALSQSLASAANFSGLFDKGGSIASGKWGIAGEYGPEIVEGPARITSRKKTAEMMGQQGQDDAMSVDVNVTNSGQPKQATASTRMEDGKMVIDVLLQDLDGDGRYIKALRGRTNLQRRGS